MRGRGSATGTQYSVDWHGAYKTANAKGELEVFML